MKSKETLNYRKEVIIITLRKEHKSKTTKQYEALERLSKRGNDLEQLKKLNAGNFYAKKERTKIAKRCGVPFSETFNV